MTSSNRKRNIVIKPRFYFFLVLFIVLIIWIVTALVNYFQPPKIEWGRLSTDQEISAIIVRDEQVVNSTEYGKFESVAGESELVEQGNEVAKIYKNEFSESDLKNLIAKQQDIKNYQEDYILKNVIHDDLIRIDDEIDRLIKEISDLVHNDKNRMLPSKEYELKKMMEKRKKYLSETLQIDSTLKQMFLTENTLRDKIQRSVVNLQAPSDGIISFFLDGMEAELTEERVEYIDTDKYTLIEDQLLNSSIASNINSNAMVATNDPVYRIVNPNHWYAMIKMPRNKNTLVKGGICDVTFESYKETISNVYVADVRQYGREVIIVLEINSEIGPMTSLRMVKGNLGRSNEGFKVPLEVLAQQDGKIGIIIVKQDKSKIFVPVDILAQNNFEVVISVASGCTEQLTVGLELVKP